MMKYKLYCDLDGVLADFMGSITTRFFDGKDWDKLKQEHDINDKKWTSLFRSKIKGHPDFWETITMMPDAQHLWSGIKKHNPNILSAFATWDHENSKRGKLIWVAKHLRVPENRIILVEREDKIKYASSTSILIDDYAKNISEWEKAGGIGIVHTSAAKTLDSLKSLGVK